MTTPLDLADRLSSHRPVLDDAEVDLTTFLEMFSFDEVTPTAPRRSLRSSGARLRGWVQDSSRRAAGWGVVPVSADVPEHRVAVEASK